MVFSCLGAAGEFCKYLLSVHDSASHRQRTHLHPRYWKCGAHLQESGRVLQLEKRTNQGMCNMFVCGAAHIPQQGEGSDDQGLYLLLCIYLYLLTHEMVPVSISKSQKLVKRIMEAKAAFFQSLFHQSYFICCSRRHHTEKAERVK